MTHNQFKNYLTQVHSGVSGSRVAMFVVRPIGLPIIHEVPAEKLTLEELGIADSTDVVIFDTEEQPD